MKRLLAALLRLSSTLAVPLAAGLALSLVVDDVEAAKPKDRPVAIYVEGPDAETIGGDVVDALPEGLTMKDPAEYKAELAKAGQKGALGKGLDNDKQKAKLYEKLRKAASAAGVDAVIVVRTSTAKGQTKAKLVILETESDLVALETEITLPAKGKKKKEEAEKERAAAVAEAVAPALKKLAPVPEPEPEPKPVVEETPKEPEKKDEPEEPSGPREKHVVAHSLVDVGLGLDLGFRSLSFTDKKTNNVRGYSVSGTPGIYLSAETYPLAGGKSFLKDLGLTLDFAQAVALKSSVSSDPSGTNLATTWRRWMISLRYRIRTGEKAPVLGLGVGYGGETFSIDASGVLADQTPSVDYKIVRLGADIRQSFGPFSLLANVAYLVVPSGGPVADRFTDAKLSGAEFGLGAAYMVTSGFELRAIGRFRHVGYTFSPKTGDAYVASGASDNLQSLMIGAAYVF